MKVKWRKHSNLQRDAEMHILSFFVAPYGEQQGKLCACGMGCKQRQMQPSAKFQQRKLCFILN